MSSFTDPNELIAKFKKKNENRQKRQERKAKKSISQFEDGVSILLAPKDEEGKRRVLRDKFLDILTRDLNDALKEEEFTPEEIERLQFSFSKGALAPSSAVVLTCPGATRCPYSGDCELVAIGKTPEGRKCPYETAFFAEFLAKAIEEFEVDPSNGTEMGFCNELAATDLLIRRADMSLSKVENADLIYETLTFDKMGNEIINHVISPHLEARDRLVKRRDKIVNLMVGDRKEKYKRQAALKLKDESVLSITQSNKANKVLEMKLKDSNKLEAPEVNMVTPDVLLDEDV